jgi:hypothetical protein
MRSVNLTKGGKRIPLSAFDKQIVIVRTSSRPDPADESWIKDTVKIGEFWAAYEPGEIKLIKGEKVGKNEYHTFIIPADDRYDFTLADMLAYGKSVFTLSEYKEFTLGGRSYYQIDALPFGKAELADFNMVPSSPDQTSPITEEDDSNLFWQ